MPKKPKPKKTGRINHVSVSRLFNLGNYENVKYELSAEVAKGECPSATLIAINNVLLALRPISRPNCLQSLRDARKLPLTKRNEYQKANYSAWLEAEKEYLSAVQARREAVEALDKMGASSTYTDHKVNWGDDDVPW